MNTGVGVGVGVGDGDGVPPIAPSGSAIAMGDAAGDGFGVGLVLTTPLFQTNFLPDFVQVYVLLL